MRTSRPGFLLRAAATLTAAGLVLTGCGSSEEPTDAKASPSAPAEPDHEPLTGVELPEGQTAARKHPAYIVKIDNTSASDPQYGLAKADMVVQELVEGGVTRLAVAYYSQLPKEAGPVRSMRATDAGIAAPIDAKIMTSGAAPYTFAQLKKHDVEWIDMSTPYVVRDTSKPHDYLHSVVGKVAKAGNAAALFTDKDGRVVLDLLVKGQSPKPGVSWDTQMAQARLKGKAKEEIDRAKAEAQAKADQLKKEAEEKAKKAAEDAAKKAGEKLKGLFKR